MYVSTFVAKVHLIKSCRKQNIRFKPSPFKHFVWSFIRHLQNVLFWRHCISKQNIWETLYEASYKVSQMFHLWNVLFRRHCLLGLGFLDWFYEVNIKCLNRLNILKPTRSNTTICTVAHFRIALPKLFQIRPILLQDLGVYTSIHPGHSFVDIR